MLREDDTRKLLAVEIDYLRRSARMPRLERVRNYEIIGGLKAASAIVDGTQVKGVEWLVLAPEYTNHLPY